MYEIINKQIASVRYLMSISFNKHTHYHLQKNLLKFTLLRNFISFQQFIILLACRGILTENNHFVKEY